MTTFPFSAVVGQDDLKLALLLNAVDPAIGGLLVRGQRGTAKSTTVRAMSLLLPDLDVVAGDPYNRAPGDVDDDDDRVPPLPEGTGVIRRPTPLVELPVGASEDRLAGSLDLERALVTGVRAFEPGLLAAANRGVLYVDEVNLLTDHLVDLLLDAAAMGVNHVEREGVSVRHPARFLLVGTMNPEEGELRPQLLDRFGLTVTVTAPADTTLRSEVIRRRLAFDANPAGFAGAWADQDRAVADRVVEARDRLEDVATPDAMLVRIAHVCARFEVDGLRADVVIARAARAHAAWCCRREITLEDVRVGAWLALPHRRRRGPLEQPGIDRDELERVLREPLPPDDPDDPPPPDGRVDDSRTDPGPPVEAGTPPPPRDGTSPTHGTMQAPDDHDHPAGPSCTDTRSQQVDGMPVAGPDGDHQGGTVHAAGAPGRPPLLVVPGSGRGARGRRSSATADHGAVVGAQPRRPGEAAHDLAASATLRAAAPHQAARGRTGRGLEVRPEDLRRRVRHGREGNLVVFVVDASGSMGASQRMRAVKGAIRGLLLDAYQRRDRIALVTFAGHDATLALPPTSSVEVADRRLAHLPTGGRTPLAAGLRRATEVVTVEATRDPLRRPLLVVLTDGRANVGGPDPRAAATATAEQVAGRGIHAVVVDTETGFVRLGLAADLATSLRAPLLRLDDLADDDLATVVRHTVQGRGAAA